MRKRFINQQNASAVADAPDLWKDLSELAIVEVTSEDPVFPIECVFRESGTGWRANRSGAQQIRLAFDQPVSLLRIQLRFEKLAVTRTQEFCLSWSATNSAHFTEIIRQQWNFSPHG
jgi:hypothetical protein